MKPTVYLETTVISYLTAWPSSEPIMAAHQTLARRWWEKCSPEYRLVVSQLVIDEISKGDPAAAAERLKVAEGLEVLEVSHESAMLAEGLISSAALPERATDDAIHIAVSATNGVDYLLTWNCRHIANATMRGKIERTCRILAYQPPVICTPEELLGEFANAD